MSVLSASTRKARFKNAVRGWPTALLLVGLVITVAISFNASHWVRDSSPVVIACLTGLIIGLMLTATRWPGWAAGLYSLVLSLLLTAQMVGNLLPGFGVLFSQPILLSAETTRLKIFTLILRAGGWVDALRAGETINDTGLFILVFCLLGWNAAVWLAWWVVRRRQAMVGLLPLSFLLAVNVHLDQQGRAVMVYYLFLVMAVIARGSFSAYQVNWIRRKVDFSEDLSIDWGFSALMGSFMVVAIALVFSFVGTKEGWMAMQDLVEKSRRGMSDTATQLFSGVKPPPPPDPASTPSGPVVRTPNLGEIGSPLPLGNEVVFRVWVSDPPPVPEEIRGASQVEDVIRHNWRSQIYSHYTGRGWVQASQVEAPAPITDPVPAGRYRLDQRYEILARPSGILFGVNDAVETSANVQLLAVGADASRLVTGSATSYQVSSFATNLTVQQMETAGTEYPAEITATYIDLPPILPERVIRLAREVAGDGTPYNQAIRIQDYLRANYLYDLTVAPPPSGRDVVDYFLFDVQAGFCSHFASTMVVMLRAVGVPARIVAGYAMGAYDSQISFYNVRASASHAWVEVFFPGFGWVEFEPTPAYAAFNYPEGNRPGGISSQAGSFIAPKPTPDRGFGWLLLPIGVVLGLWTVFFVMRSRRLRGVDLSGQAGLLYRQTLRELAWAGLPARPSQTPTEYLSAFESRLEPYPRVLDGLRKITHLYIQTIYSPHPIEYTDVQMNQWRWRHARGEWVMLMLRRIIQSRKKS